MIKGSKHRKDSPALLTGWKHSEETRMKIGLKSKGRKNNYPKNRKSKPHSDETKRKLSLSKVGENNPWFGKKLPKEIKMKMSDAHKGKKCHLWKGGISFSPYCPKFNRDFKERVREFFVRRCAECGKEEKCESRKLSVHHVNFNKMACCDDTKPLFVPLCRSCHSATNSNRDYWQARFTNLIETKYGGKCWVAISRDGVVTLL